MMDQQIRHLAALCNEAENPSRNSYETIIHHHSDRTFDHRTRWIHGRTHFILGLCQPQSRRSLEDTTLKTIRSIFRDGKIRRA